MFSSGTPVLVYMTSSLCGGGEHRCLVDHLGGLLWLDVMMLDMVYAVVER